MTAHLPELTALLIDAVDSGASVGFLPPRSETEADAYWLRVRDAVQTGSRILLGAFEDGVIVGSVQLELATAPNGSHRAEVTKLFVLRSVRGRGFGTRLMQAIEDEARRHGRRLLVLDTRSGDAAERLYRRLGYVQSGVIPRYAKSARGTLDATVIMYRWIG